MITSKLFDIAKKAINDFSIGIPEVKGDKIELSNVFFDVMKINKKYFSDLPFSIKYFSVKEICVKPSIMSFVGEKPIDININIVKIVLMPSFNLISNSKDIRTNFLNNFSLRKKSVIFSHDSVELSTDSLIDKFIKFAVEFTTKFLSMNNYSMNILLRDISIHFEDDTLLNHRNFISFTLPIKEIEIKNVNEGYNRKNTIDIKNLSLVYNNTRNIVVPTIVLTSNENNIKKFYDIIGDINIDILENRYTVIDKFNARIAYGFNFDTETSNFKPNNNVKIYYDFDFHDITLNITPKVLNVLFDIWEFCRNFYSVTQMRNNNNGFLGEGKKKMKNIVNFVLLLKRFQKFSAENLLRKEFNRYMANYGYDIHSIELGEESKYPTYSYDSLADDKSSDNKKNLNLQVNIHLIRFGLKMSRLLLNIFTPNFSNHISLDFNYICANCEINQLKTSFDSSIKSFNIYTENIVKTAEKDLPKFLLKHKAKKTSNSIINSISPMSAGLKASPLMDETASMKSSSSALYKQNARYFRRMRILSETLQVSRNPMTNFKSRNYNPSLSMYNENYIKAYNSNFLEKILPKEKDPQNNIKEIIREKRNNSLSKAIKEYNSNKIFGKIESLSKSVSGLSPILPTRGLSMINNSIISVSKNAKPLCLLSLGVANDNAIVITYSKDSTIKNSNFANFQVNSVRVNFFYDYMRSILATVESYKSNPFYSYLLQTNLGMPLINIKKDIAVLKYLYLMKKEIKAKIEKNFGTNKKKYLPYYNSIKSFISKYPSFDFGTYESSFLFSYYFTNAIELNIQITNLTFLYYETVNNLLAHVHIEKIPLEVYLSITYFYLKCSENEVEVTSLESVGEIIKIIKANIKSIFSPIELVVKPCLDKILKEIKEKKNKPEPINDKENSKLSNSREERFRFNTGVAAHHENELEKDKEEDLHKLRTMPAFKLVNKDNNL